MGPSKDDDLVDNLHDLNITEEEDDEKTNGNYIPFRIDGKPAPGSTKSDIPRYLIPHMHRPFPHRHRRRMDQLPRRSRPRKQRNKHSCTNGQARRRRNDKRAPKAKADPCRRYNHVSWTSSLLRALLYIFHRHTDSANNDDDDEDSDGSELEDIYLCVLDTSSYNERAYIRATSLMAAFREYSTDLAEQQRSSQPCHWGEYLTQGALNIEGACEIVPADELVECGLFTLLPELEALAARWKRNGKPTAPSWNELLEEAARGVGGWRCGFEACRGAYGRGGEVRAKDCGAVWRVFAAAVAAALAALRRRRDGDPRLVFRPLKTDGTFVFSFVCSGYIRLRSIC